MKNAVLPFALALLFALGVMAGPGSSKWKRVSAGEQQLQPIITIKVKGKGTQTTTHQFLNIDILDLSPIPTCFFKLITVDNKEFFVGPRTGAKKVEVERLIQRIQDAAKESSVEITIKFFSCAYPSTWGAQGILEEYIYKLDSISIKNYGSLDIRAALKDPEYSLFTSLDNE